LLGEDGLILMKQMINNACETEEWRKYLIELKIIVLRKESKATKFRDHRTFNISVHTEKKVASILRRRIATKIRDVLGEDQFRI